MKLKHLQITPDGNTHGIVAEIAIDPTPGIFKSRYFALARLQDGSTHISSQPLNMSEDDIKAARAYAEQLLADLMTVVAATNPITTQ